MQKWLRNKSKRKDDKKLTKIGERKVDKKGEGGRKMGEIVLTDLAIISLVLSVTI